MKNYTNTNIYSSHNSSRGQRFRQTVSNTMRCNGQCVLVHCQNLQMITQHSRHLIWTWSILYLWVWPPEQQQSHISNGEKLIKSAEMLPFNFRRAWRISEIVCNLVIILVLHSQSNSSSHTKWFFKIFPFNKFMTWVCASPTRIMYGSNSHTTVSSFIVVYVCMERSTLGHAHFVTTLPQHIVITTAPYTVCTHTHTPSNALLLRNANMLNNYFMFELMSGASAGLTVRGRWCKIFWGSKALKSDDANQTFALKSPKKN